MPGRHAWSPSLVHHILADPVYAGTAYANRYSFVPPKKPRRPYGPRTGEATCRQLKPREQWIAIPVPAIVDQETWDRAQAQLARNAALSFRNNTKHNYLRVCRFSSLRSRRLAARLSRRFWTRTSSTTPSWSTARQSQCFCPLIIRHTSSRCHLSPGQGSRRRIWLAKSCPNLRAHCRTVSWLTSMPRAASISSTMRRLSGKRKYSHTAWLMISPGKR